MTDETLREELARLRADVDRVWAELAHVKSDLAIHRQELEAERERLRRMSARGGLTMKVSEKGALSVYGLGRFPVTLYKEQWERLLSHAEDLISFMAANEASLKKRETAE